MNKRIRELALQAGIDFLNCTNPEHGDREYCEAWTEQQQKFAELIVLECMNVCREQRNPQNLNYKPSERFAEVLRQHFGVEE